MIGKDLDRTCIEEYPQIHRTGAARDIARFGHPVRLRMLARQRVENGQSLRIELQRQIGIRMIGKCRTKEAPGQERSNRISTAPVSSCTVFPAARPGIVDDAAAQALDGFNRRRQDGAVLKPQVSRQCHGGWKIDRVRHIRPVGKPAYTDGHACIDKGLEGIIVSAEVEFLLEIRHEADPVKMPDRNQRQVLAPGIGVGAVHQAVDQRPMGIWIIGGAIERQQARAFDDGCAEAFLQ